MARSINPDCIPCNQTKLVHGRYWDAPPEYWKTRQDVCATCRRPFVTTAAEQQFWYEELHIPLIVTINRCVGCRGKQRVYRRLMDRMSALMPIIDAQQADARVKREVILTLAEGMVRHLATSGDCDRPIFSGDSILQKVASLIGELREESPRHDDLLPILIIIHQRLDNQVRVERLQAELSKASERSVPLGKAIRAIQTWLSCPTKRLREKISEPPRI